ncbi:VOC family protein [Mycolicibacterium sp. 624]|uniref:VOC family protein n=1 Tax=Mycolicibacterium sp. 624 TaxID=3156314 RepID=UPI003398668F
MTVPLTETVALTTTSLIDHVAIAAHDAAMSAEWFERTLGLQRHHDEIVEDAGVRLIWLVPCTGQQPSTAATMQIVQPLRDGPVAHHLAERGEGLHHVCFAVPDLAASLRDVGEDPSQIFTGGYGKPCAFLKAAPTGCAIELVERTP